MSDADLKIEGRTPEEQVQALTRTLERLKQEHKSKLAAIAADPAALEKLAKDKRVAELVTERDAAKSEAAKVRGEWDTEKVARGIDSALGESAILPEARELAKAKAIAAGFTIGKDGKLATKEGLGVQDWIRGVLAADAPSFFPRSVGGGGRGSTMIPDNAGFNPNWFNPAHKDHSVTEMGKALRRWPAEARRAAQRFGFPIHGGVS